MGCWDPDYAEIPNANRITVRYFYSGFAGVGALVRNTP